MVGTFWERDLEEVHLETYTLASINTHESYLLSKLYAHPIPLGVAEDMQTLAVGF
jgi:hypothetical protein